MSVDILAGPILRRTTDKCICVWLATDEKLDFVLEILDAATNKPLGRSRAKELRTSRVQLGSSLYVYLLKAYPIESKYFEANVFYYYTLLDEQGKPLDLKSIGLTYGDHQHPIFHIPGTLNSVLHGSCRKPHGDMGQDCLVVGDSLLEETHNDITKRPDLLLLTGDQIYADDVDTSLMYVLIEKAKKLIGRTEALPLTEYGDTEQSQVTPSSIKLGGRLDVLKENHSGLSSQESGNHLMGFGEFAAMYIYVFGNAQRWQILDRPENEDDHKKLAATGFGQYLEQFRRLLYKVLNKNKIKKVDPRKAVTDFDQNLDKVRRLLANIPTYMIFDDHDVTDDWNITGNWYDKVRSSPLGRRIVSNALATYWAFQGWGNDPDNFDKEMIDVIKKYVNNPILNTDPENEELYDLLTWKHRGWGFSVATSPPIIAIDSRTQRQSDNAYYPTRLLDRYGLDGLRLEWNKLKAIKINQKDNNEENNRQGKKLFDDGTCPILIATTPVLGFAPLEYIFRLLLWSVSYIENLLLIKFIENLIGDLLHKKVRGCVSELLINFVDGEAWTTNLEGFTDLMDTLLHRMNIKRCVFLSGDVHYSFTAAGTYSSRNQYSLIQKTLQCYQLTSSSLRNSPKDRAQLNALNDLEKSEESFWPKLREWSTKYLCFYRTWQVDYKLLKSETHRRIYKNCNLGQVIFEDGMPVLHKLWHTQYESIEYKIPPKPNL
jgi:hypothetical protein